MDPLSSALAVLTAMITPAVLISACGTMILSTSSRLGRVVDRVRGLSDRFEEMVRAGEEEVELYEERRAVMFDQLERLTTRARLLQRCMTTFYTALGVFSWLPVVTGILGALCLLYGSVLLIFEARLALSTITSEMDFLWRLGKTLAPRHLVQERSPHHNRLTLRHPR
jgi:hypothetical protein